MNSTSESFQNSDLTPALPFGHLNNVLTPQYYLSCERGFYHLTLEILENWGITPQNAVLHSSIFQQF